MDRFVIDNERRKGIEMNEHNGDLPDRNDKTLTLVRELGFDSFMCVQHGMSEKVLFFGPQMLDENYVANGCSNKTHEWR